MATRYLSKSVMLEQTLELCSSGLNGLEGCGPIRLAVKIGFGEWVIHLP